MRRDRQDRGDPEALVERAHDRLLAAEADEIGADDRGEDADAADDQRQAISASSCSAPALTSSAISTMVAPTVTT